MQEQDTSGLECWLKEDSYRQIVESIDEAIFELDTMGCCRSDQVTGKETRTGKSKRCAKIRAYYCPYGPCHGDGAGTMFEQRDERLYDQTHQAGKAL